MIQAPIFHVNGEDPEAAVYVAELALEFRQTFNRDVVIDMYLLPQARPQRRRRAVVHAAADVRARSRIGRSLTEIYTEQLIMRGDLTAEETEAIKPRVREQARQDAGRGPAPARRSTAACTASSGHWKGLTLALFPRAGRNRRARARRCARSSHATDARPRRTSTSIPRSPACSRAAPGRSRPKASRSTGPFAERWRSARLLLEGTPVRLSGQDSRRGTFSQRHAVLYDARHRRALFTR